MSGPVRLPRRETFRVDDHPRRFADNRYVYAVLSRRARGLSIGINLNPDKRCNFDCIYCQVDRSVPSEVDRVDEAVLLAELRAMLAAAARGELTDLARLDGVPDAMRRVADVAFSGDGEPTTWPGFDRLVGTVGDAIDALLPGVPMTLITNASTFHLRRVRRALDALTRRGGRVWAKLDAGTDEYYRFVAVTKVPFARILDNIREQACRHPLVIQSLFLRFRGEGPSSREIDAWAARLAGIVAAGGALAGVQVTTVARRPPTPDVTALDAADLDRIAAAARQAVPGVPVETFPARLDGADGNPEEPRS
ncbi:MAG: radical SAM protein [Acidobacteriota bacterium]